ncbi:MAG: tripartite tricarboxylate transporter TctB family protein [Stomatobaculum sp.]|nr:tripartite tricarboxylate transporter TctB family protein [Stomatobaculum sp.]
MENRKLHQDVFVGLGSLVFVAWVLFLNRKLPLGSALMPHLLCGILALLGIIILVQGLNKTKRQNPEEMKELLNADILKVPLICWLFVLGYVILFLVAGYFIATAVMLVALMRYMKRTDWKMIILITVCYLAFIYFVFVRQFGLNLFNLGLLGRM